jgi:molecular chaperone GrpE
MTDFAHDADPQTPRIDPEPAPPRTALQEDPEEVRRERDDYRDRLLRSLAEFDNYRKRIERERRELAEFVSFEILGDLLPFVDDLERALAAAPGSTAEDNTQTLAGYRAGVELVYKQVAELLRKKGVTAIEAKGADFDPHVHQAVASEISESHRDNEVIDELRRGYRLGERLLRPAMVKVAKRG